MKPLMKTKRGFTIIELTIAVAMVAILGSLVTINFTQSRRNARDGVRKADAPAILTAVSQYVQANGTSLIRSKDTASNNLLPCNTSPTPANGTGCVGADGKSFGKINAKNIADTAGDVGLVGSTATRRVYPATSIAEALLQGGYFDVKPIDPLSKNAPVNDIATRDYVLIRACPNGEQHLGARGQLFAVWTLVENRLTTSDLESIKKLPGKSVELTGPPRTYVYDFAAGVADNLAFRSSAYGVGNAGAVGSISSAEGACSPSA
jgi:prepilin-type N-terminal cleavage/methylation domain-containing protein